jgi:AcrR family transcriptional regulator
VNERGGGGRPTKAQAAARTETLLDTARALFCTRGFAATSIEEIAAVLRASKHTIYRRYASKLLLLEAVVERDAAGFRQTLLAAGATETEPLASLRAMARAYFAFSASPEYSALYAAIALEAATSAALRDKLLEWAAAALEPLRRALAVATPPSGWRTGQGNDPCEILIDLLDGQANRVKWQGDGDPNQLERAFAARWDLFRRMA